MCFAQTITEDKKIKPHESQKVSTHVSIMSCRYNHEWWLRDFPWLIYEHSLKLMICLRCWAADEILSGKNPSVNGTSIFKWDNLMKHNKSKCHMLVEMPT